MHQAPTAILLVSAQRGVALAPASAASLTAAGATFRRLDHGGDSTIDADPERPVELHAIWSRQESSPVARRVLEVIERVTR